MTNEINRGSVKSTGETDRGEFGIGIPMKQKSSLQNAGGAVIDGEMPQRSTLLKKKTDNYDK